MQDPPQMSEKSSPSAFVPPPLFPEPPAPPNIDPFIPPSEPLSTNGEPMEIDDFTEIDDASSFGSDFPGSEEGDLLGDSDDNGWGLIAEPLVPTKVDLSTLEPASTSQSPSLYSQPLEHHLLSSEAHGPQIFQSASPTLELTRTSQPSSLHSQSPKSRPVSFGAHGTQLFQPAPKGPGLCTVCKSRPAYDDGLNHYPTCGFKCATKHSGPSNQFRGPQHGPSIRGATSSSFSPGLSTSNHWMVQLQQNQPRNTARLIKMCEVCGDRPRFQKGGKTYPTCGLACAQKLRDAKVGVCDFCKQRPKVVLDGKVYPHCGRTCRDQAKLAASGSPATKPTPASCETCLICWKAPKRSTHGDICSPACQTFLERKAPFLVEVPRGHVAFEKVANFFASNWKTGTKSCPAVKRIYMIALKPGFTAKYEEYRSKVNSHGFFTKKGNEKKRWIGLIRECGFGNPGNMEPCSGSRCMLCSLTRNTASRSNFPEGITTADAPNRATDVSSQITKRFDSKVLLVADVLLGREIEMEHDRLIDPLPPQGSDSVHMIGYHPYRGTKMDFGEVVVYHGDAIKPLYLVSFA